MFLIFFVLSQFEIPTLVQVAVGLIGGALMVFMGVQTFRNRHKQETAAVNVKRESVQIGRAHV
jgi:threonine/homoserine/homoserine lactone efflux protein